MELVLLAVKRVQELGCCGEEVNLRLRDEIFVVRIVLVALEEM